MTIQLPQDVANAIEAAADGDPAPFTVEARTMIIRPRRLPFDGENPLSLGQVA